MAAVEIHRDVGEQRDLLPNSRAIAEAVSVVCAGTTVHIPAPTNRLLHNAFHAQVQDRGFALGKVPLRELDDVARLVGRYAAEIDWPRLDEVFRRSGYGRAWSAYRYMAHRLLGVPMPAIEAATGRDRRHLKRCLFQLDEPLLTGALGLWAAATQPLRRCRIEYLYGRCANPLTLNLYRLRRTAELAREYRWRAFARISTLRQTHRT